MMRLARGLAFGLVLMLAVGLSARAQGGGGLRKDMLDLAREKGRVLMVGFMNEEAFEKTVESGFATFFSRSRNKLWLKGESSGHRLVVKNISTDCDLDALLIQVEALGPGVCHEGYQSCFFRKLEGGEWKESEPRAYDPEAVYGGKA